jgi:hypothetical protein
MWHEDGAFDVPGSQDFTHGQDHALVEKDGPDVASSSNQEM